MQSQMGFRKHYYKQDDRGDGIPVELIQILKDGAVKVLHSICQQIWNTQLASGLEKVNPHLNSQQSSTKECSNRTIVLTSHASKVTLKILQARPQHYVN